jgi:hypothetical protein
MPRTAYLSEDFGVTSSQTTLSPLTLCGKYSVIGGIGAGIKQTLISKYFKPVQVHTSVDITFTLFLIDQNQDDTNEYQVFIDGVLYADKTFTIQPETFGWALSN